MRQRPLLIFAAGFGTRMGALTRDRPKPLVPVAGRPLVDRALDLAEEADCAPVVANLHYRAEMLEAHLGPRGVRTLTERPEILETGGGLRNALPHLGQGPVMTLNPDAVWQGPNPLPLLEAAWDPSRMSALLMLVPRAQALGHAGQGDFIRDETGRLTRGAGEVYGGAQIVDPTLLSEIPEEAFSLNRLWDLMLARGGLYGISYPGHWCDVGSPEGITRAEALLADADV